ncbi:MAG: His/Gly/Thr/Pro-type tRNA ligase C-terminal domain-containing protein, partial [Saprospiraceae bacterium]
VPDAEGGEATRVVLKIHPVLAPIKCAVLPLVKNKPELVEKARQILNLLKPNFLCQYDDKDAIGRRYRRQDAIGTPFCVTVDFETLEDQCVTIRDRDTLVQERIAIQDVSNYIQEKVNWNNLF